MQVVVEGKCGAMEGSDSALKIDGKVKRTERKEERVVYRERKRGER